MKWRRAEGGGNTMPKVHVTDRGKLLKQLLCAQATRLRHLSGLPSPGSLSDSSTVSSLMALLHHFHWFRCRRASGTLPLTKEVDQSDWLAVSEPWLVGTAGIPSMPCEADKTLLPYLASESYLITSSIVRSSLLGS